MGGSHSQSSEKNMIQIAPNFWNIRGSFKVVLGMVDIRTHMSLIKLNNNKFLVIDTIPFSGNLQNMFNEITNNGNDIEAVIATHPFHTMAFKDFYEKYPNIDYYGTPRHLRTIKDIPWKGTICDESVKTKWNSEVEFRIPDGAEWDNPLPESYNHFVSCWVYSKLAKTIHVDDTLIYMKDAPFTAKLVGYKDDTLMFHPSISGPGLKSETCAPYEFKNWVQDILNNWEIDNICCAHMDNKIGGGSTALQNLLNNSEDVFKELSENAKDNSLNTRSSYYQKYNVKGCECG